MRRIDLELLKSKVIEAIVKMNYHLSDEMASAFQEALSIEDNDLAKKVLSELIENANIAKTKKIPMCQDTGIVVCFLEIGTEIYLEDFESVINEAVRKAYVENYLRKSVVGDPITRVNTLDNTPAIIHTKIVPGDNFNLKICCKGAGSENMSVLKMMSPSEGIEGIKEFILETVKNTGGKACPPLTLGIGIGGNFETCALLSKKALFKKEELNDEIVKLENEIKNDINELGIGPLGFGGKTTCVKVSILKAPCHIASMPVAINIQCHANRHEEIVM